MYRARGICEVFFVRNETHAGNIPAISARHDVWLSWPVAIIERPRIGK